MVPGPFSSWTDVPPKEYRELFLPRPGGERTVLCPAIRSYTPLHFYRAFDGRSYDIRKVCVISSFRSVLFFFNRNPACPFFCSLGAYVYLCEMMRWIVFCLVVSCLANSLYIPFVPSVKLFWMMMISQWLFHFCWCRTEVVEIQLDVLRNNILRFELLLSISAFTVSLGALVTGVYQETINIFTRRTADQLPIITSSLFQNR